MPQSTMNITGNVENFFSEAVVFFDWNVFIIIFHIVIIVPLTVPLVYVLITFGAGFSYIQVYYLLWKLRGREINTKFIEEMLPKFWFKLTKFVYGHEFICMDDYTDKGPFIILQYHPNFYVTAGPVFGILLRLFKNNTYQIIDRKHARITSVIFSKVSDFWHLGSWSRDECIQLINSGKNLSILPGGTLEVRMSDENYRLLWKGIGYARIAKETKAKIIFIVTLNSQEAFRMPWYARPFLRGLCPTKNFPFTLCHGGLPVKLTTLLSPVMSFDYNLPAEELAVEIKNEFQKFIDKYQQIPGSQWQALKERFGTKPYWKVQMEKEGTRFYEADERYDGHDSDEDESGNCNSESHSLLMNESV